MKVNKIERSRKPLALAILAIVVLLAITIGLVLGYGRLKELYLEQCVITDMYEQVKISSGKMVKSDVLAENFGLRKGANLALIDFKAKREEILKRIPNLKAISISRRLPAKVTIVAEEREPVARLNVVGRKSETGRVTDQEGVVFLCQRGTRLLPVIREPSLHQTAVGQRLHGRSRAALELVNACRLGDFSELGLLDADISKPDYIFSTISYGNNYSSVKIAWEDMDENTPASRASLERQLSMLLKAVRVAPSAGVVIWNATDTSTPGRIYADTKGLVK